MTFISLIIPAYNEERFLGRTIERLQFALAANQSEELTWEIILCDNNSTDKTAELAAQLGARVVFEPVNQISRARNTGAGIAQGDWYLFVDADSYPPPKLMAEAIAVIADGGHIGCGTTVVVEGGTLFNKLRMERLNPLFRHFNLSGGAFLICQSDAFRALGGFSTDLYAYEEIDFVLRLKRFGAKRGEKFVVLHHHPVVTSGRKADIGLVSLGRLFASNLIAVLLFILYYILPRGLVRKLGSSLLGYWYRRE